MQEVPLRLTMTESASSLSAFLLSPNETPEDLPPLFDDDEFWETFIELALEHRRKFHENLNETLNTLLLFAALFSAVNVGILALSMPTLTPNPIIGTDPATPSSQPSKYSMMANRVFASSLTCSLLASFFSLCGKQWLSHYKKLGPTAHLENRKILQRQLDGTIRWRFEGLVEVGLTTLLQTALILFLLEWVPYLHWQGNHVSYPINGLAHFGAFLLVLMLGCASWDRWCPYQTPYTTTIPRSFGKFIALSKHFTLSLLTASRRDREALQMRVKFDTVRETISAIRSRPIELLLSVLQRPEETDEDMDIKSLCWMLENAPRGRPLSRVAQHMSAILSQESDRRQRGGNGMRILESPYLSRIHETFWHLLLQTRRLTHGKLENANEMPDMLVEISIFGRSIVYTSAAHLKFSTVAEELEPPSLLPDIRAAFKESFDRYSLANTVSWEDVCPFLDLQVVRDFGTKKACLKYLSLIV
ncbi:hypothetical protein BDZ97DRAFT_771770 [Flammula alnicola]|nr:hypothetical protein BDZ97DRAFT_771770 [Flammula alnicola]